MEDENLWQSFYQSYTWKSLLQEYDEALVRVECYAAAHPEKVIPSDIHRAMQRLTLLYDHVRRAAGEPALHDQPAPSEATRIILSAVAQVKRDVPLTEQAGHA